MLDDFEMKIETRQIISQHIFNLVQVERNCRQSKWRKKMFCVNK